MSWQKSSREFSKFSSDLCFSSFFSLHISLLLPYEPIEAFLYTFGNYQDQDLWAGASFNLNFKNVKPKLKIGKKPSLWTGKCWLLVHKH